MIVYTYRKRLKYKNFQE